ncbi:MAG TPA: ornithine cyclodeaminase family protein [Clostridiaceae bacterium]|nr:ornithine cyclodeaminase family protein [Clostridiaceae bacterium]
MYIAEAELVKQFEREHEFFKTQLKLGEEILWLTQEECIEAGPTIEETLELVNQAMIYHGLKEYEMPAKIGIHPFDDVFFHAMPAYVPKNLACGMKWIECYPRNPDDYNLPQTTGLLVMNDIMTGVPVAVMDSAWLTAMRTPAVTVLAAAALHPDATTFGMFGCGVQGTEHVRFVGKTLKKLERIYIYDIIPERMDELIEKVRSEVDVPIIKADPETVVRSSEVLSSATICVPDPISFGKKEWVSAGQTILPCDLNTFWDPQISLEADKYIVDSIDEHKLFGDMGYFPDGLPEIFCETGELLAGLKEGRTSPDQLIVCSNIGISTNDVSMGHKILFKAFELGLGSKLKL